MKLKYGKIVLFIQGLHEHKKKLFFGCEYVKDREVIWIKFALFVNNDKQYT